ncbi:hypothetical protein DIS18_07000 [Algibacter marinivivus]|uniref:Uncharacterized protein n=1 Tax=Algibacter marinivivus TaxID=2100723 RepID=A0A2U2X914_9FLAO|nr:hypothetical protein [Algibacter marinivivus]PWH84276.1 hypothetical protein DIS18_07000 [Algibacter marinivivus]
MKQAIRILIIFITLVSYSQQNKKPIYFYFENKKISKKQFKSLAKKKVIIKTIENDTAIIKSSYLRKKITKIDSVSHTQINTFLKKIIGKDFNIENKTMIHLYRKNNNKINKDSEYKKYWQWIKRNSHKYQAYLVGTKTSGIEEDKANHIYLDNYNLLENLFFKDSDYEINHLLIKPNREVYIYFGLTDILGVLDSSVD